MYEQRAVEIEKLWTTMLDNILVLQENNAHTHISLFYSFKMVFCYFSHIITFFNIICYSFHMVSTNDWFHKIKMFIIKHSSSKAKSIRYIFRSGRKCQN